MAFIIVTGIELLYREETPQVETVLVYVAKDKIEVGTFIMDYMMEGVEIPKHLASEYIVKEPIEGFSVDSLEKGEFIYKHQISELAPMAIDEDERMITVKCSVVTANGWLFQINEVIDLIIVSGEDLIKLENARVCRIFGDDLTESKTPSYMSLIMSKEDAEKYFSLLSKSQVYLSKK